MRLENPAWSRARSPDESRGGEVGDSLLSFSSPLNRILRLKDPSSGGTTRAQTVAPCGSHGAHSWHLPSRKTGHRHPTAGNVGNLQVLLRFLTEATWCSGCPQPRTELSGGPGTWPFLPGAGLASCTGFELLVGWARL